MHSTLPFQILQFILGSAPPSDVSLGWGRVRSEIRSRSEMSHTFLNFPLPPACPQSWLLASAFQPFSAFFFFFFSSLQLANSSGRAPKPSCGVEALCKPLFPLRKGGLGAGSAPARCGWGARGSPCFGAVTPAVTCHPAKWGDVGQGWLSAAA